MNDNLVKMPSPEVSQSFKEFKKAVKDAKETMNLLIEFNQMNAKVLRAYYEALVMEGFTKEEALAIVKEKRL